MGFPEHVLKQAGGGAANRNLAFFPARDRAAVNPQRLGDLLMRKLFVPADSGNKVLHDPSMCTLHIPPSSAICTDGARKFLGMEAGDRLSKARVGAGYISARKAAEAMGANYNTYAQHENKIRDIPRDAAIRYARFFRISLEWLLTGKGSQKPTRPEVPIVSYVGAGAEVFAIDDSAQGSGLIMVPAPVGMEDCVGAMIKGDSMHPLRDGWLIFWQRDQSGVPEDCIGQLCVCQVRDGPTLVKDLRRGSRKGLYRLESWNAPTREDVPLEWASRIREIRPR